MAMALSYACLSFIGYVIVALVVQNLRAIIV